MFQDEDARKYADGARFCVNGTAFKIAPGTGGSRQG
jgi:hypothetical protein